MDSTAFSGCARLLLETRATATISISVNNAPSQVVSITMGPPSMSLTAAQAQQFTGNDHGNDQHSRILVNQPGGGRDHQRRPVFRARMITSTQNVTVKPPV